MLPLCELLDQPRRRIEADEHHVGRDAALPQVVERRGHAERRGEIAGKDAVDRQLAVLDVAFEHVGGRLLRAGHRGVFDVGVGHHVEAGLLHFVEEAASAVLGAGGALG